MSIRPSGKAPKGQRDAFLLAPASDVQSTRGAAAQRPASVRAPSESASCSLSRQSLRSRPGREYHRARTRRAPQGLASTAGSTGRSCNTESCLACPSPNRYVRRFLAGSPPEGSGIQNSGTTTPARRWRCCIAAGDAGRSGSGVTCQRLGGGGCESRASARRDPRPLQAPCGFRGSAV